MAYFLAHLSDFHLLPTKEDEFVGVKPWYHLQACFADLQEQYQSYAHLPSSIICTGDIIHEQGDVSASLSLFGQALEDNFPEWSFIFTPGNHDNITVTTYQQLSAFHTHFQQSPKRVAFYGLNPHWCVITLDSHKPSCVHGRLHAEDAQQVVDYITTHHYQNYILALHHNLQQVNCAWLDSHRFEGVEEFIAVLAKHPQVTQLIRFVLHGHIHQQRNTLLTLRDFCATAHGNLLADLLFPHVDEPYLLTIAAPACSFQFKPESDTFALDPIYPGYNYFILHDDGRFELHQRRVPVDLFPQPTIAGY